MIDAPQTMISKESRSEPARKSTVAGAHQVAAPLAPSTLAETGLSLQLLCDLVLKTLHMQGNGTGIGLSHEICLPFKVLDEALRFLKDEKCIEVVTGELIGRMSYRYTLTDLGRSRAFDALNQCRYVGPAPVPLSAYVAQSRKQAVTGTQCEADTLREVFSHLIIPDELISELGPAICSGKSIFIYGPPGNGKTMIAKGISQYLNLWGGEIYVPYAFLAQDGIVTVFDPTVHQATDEGENAADYVEDPTEKVVSRLLRDRMPDPRWRRIRRPVVITGGELTLDMLDLRYNSAANFYQAPLHIKANGGVFLIDDFGRQIVSPRDLLNRWILPLEERQDFLTLATGKKFTVPFEQLIIFSTNLEPRELVDEAFLRRIRHKILIDTPPKEHYDEIFRLFCNRLDLEFDAEALGFMHELYESTGIRPRSSDPRDLLEIVLSICRFRNQPAELNKDLLAQAAERYFSKI
jgi:hypothetical protein